MYFIVHNIKLVDMMFINIQIYIIDIFFRRANDSDCNIRTNDE